MTSLEMLIEILKVGFLFYALRFSVINTFRWAHGQNIPNRNFLYQFVSITGFVYLQWLAGWI